MRDAIRFYDRLTSSLSRRELMKLAWFIGATTIAPPIVSRRLWAQPIFDAYPFPLGVASGDPLPDGVVLWTRLAPKPLEGGGMPMATVPVGWEVARDPQFRQIAQKGSALARPELGHSVHVEVSGLEAGREYWYRFHAGDEVSQVGRTKTAPPAGAAVDRLRFGVCGCSHYEIGYFTACRRLAEEQFDFVFHTGDYIYEGRPNGGRSDALVRQHHGHEPYTLDDYRLRYAQYKMDADLKAAHASAPFVMAWDDHEVENNYAADRDENGTPPEIFLLRRAAAYQAYYETMPLRASALPSGAAYADLPPDAVWQPDRLLGSRHSPVAIGPGVRRRCPHRLCRSARTVADHAWSRAGKMAVRQPGDDQDALDDTGAAGADIPQRSPCGAWRRFLDGQMGRLRRGPAAALRTLAGKQGTQTRSWSPVTCTRISVPT
jgi:hypothetical protein